MDRPAELPEIALLLAAPRGFCAGVRRAIQAVRDALTIYGSPVFVRRPIVHNLAVVRTLEAAGAVFVQELAEVPRGGVVILSAHGVAPHVADETAALGLIAFDAVCPLVAKVHRSVVAHHRAGRHVVLVGHAGHPEIEGTLGHLPAGAATLVSSTEAVARLAFDEEQPMAFAVQTTFSVGEARDVVAALEARFADIAGPSASDICYATINRQAAVKAIAQAADAVIVVGEDFSSNARRLAEVASGYCPTVQLVADAAAIDWRRLPVAGTIGLTAAASTPDESVDAVVAALGGRYRLRTTELVVADETVAFRKVSVG